MFIISLLTFTKTRTVLGHVSTYTHLYYLQHVTKFAPVNLYLNSPFYCFSVRFSLFLFIRSIKIKNGNNILNIRSVTLLRDCSY